MAKDSKGRDVAEARIYVTGFGAYADVDTANMLTKAELGSTEATLPAAFRYFGLRTVDGGPETATETGDQIEFLEAGFIVAGDGYETVKMTLAQYNDEIRELVRGRAADSNGVIEVKETTPSTQKIILLESAYRGGRIERKMGVATITLVEYAKDERGNVNGVSVTWRWQQHELFDNAFYWEAAIDTGTEPEEPESGV